MEQTAQSRVIEILPAEENPGDVWLTKEALGENTSDNYVHVVGSGVTVACPDPCFDKGGETSMSREHETCLCTLIRLILALSIKSRSASNGRAVVDRWIGTENLPTTF